jgi:hypothetical protein
VETITDEVMRVRLARPEPCPLVLLAAAQNRRDPGADEIVPG